MLDTRLNGQLREKNTQSRHANLDQPKLEAREICKSYSTRGKELVVLEKINFQLAPREFVCLVGASGCGKLIGI